jgi:uncharacterized protein YlxP (DUF503 family)
MPCVGVLILEMRLEQARSLKDKRHWVLGVKTRLRARHNVAVAEIGGQNLWNDSTLAVVTVSSSRRNAAKVLESAERVAAGFLGPHLVSASIEWLQ